MNSFLLSRSKFCSSQSVFKRGVGEFVKSYSRIFRSNLHYLQQPRQLHHRQHCHISKPSIIFSEKLDCQNAVTKNICCSFLSSSTSFSSPKKSTRKRDDAKQQQKEEKNEKKQEQQEQEQEKNEEHEENEETARRKDRWNYINFAYFLGAAFVARIVYEKTKPDLDQYPTMTENAFFQDYLANGRVHKLTYYLSGRYLVELVETDPKTRTNKQYRIENASSQLVQKLKEKEREWQIRKEEKIPVLFEGINYTSNSISWLSIALAAYFAAKIALKGRFKMSFKVHFERGDGSNLNPFSQSKTEKTTSKKKRTGSTRPKTPPPATPPPPSFLNIYDLLSGGGRGSSGLNDSSDDGRESKNAAGAPISFKDVAGLHEAKQEVREFVSYLREPDRFHELGARIPRGALLLGPPGCGKTLLIKALANETNVPFFIKSGPEFVDMIGGVGASRMRKLFQEARSRAPAIIFIDEIDAIGKKRSGVSAGGVPSGGGGSGGGGGHNDIEQTLNQLLVEMDGMDTRHDESGSRSGCVVVFAATNRSDVLDSALLRPGRFDRHILIDLPTRAERLELFQLYLKQYKLDFSVASSARHSTTSGSYRVKTVAELAETLANQTPGMTGADIANICNEAALISVRFQSDRADSTESGESGESGEVSGVRLEDFEAALERVISGAAAKHTHVMDAREKRTAAYHEAGHALLSWLLPNVDPTIKVSIIPRTHAHAQAASAGGSGAGSVGFSLRRRPGGGEQRFLHMPRHFRDNICVLLGGRASEILLTETPAGVGIGDAAGDGDGEREREGRGEVSSGAADDLKKVRKLASKMVRELGMGEQVGHLSFEIGAEEEWQTPSLPYSKATQHRMELEISQIVTQESSRALQLLRDNRDKLELLAQKLIECETLAYEDLRGILGEPVSSQPISSQPINSNTHTQSHTHTHADIHTNTQQQQHCLFGNDDVRK